MAAFIDSDTAELVFIRESIDWGRINSTQALLVAISLASNRLDGFDVTALLFISP
jgi:hypothetical protein